LAFTNTSAFYIRELITAVKRFMIQAADVSVGVGGLTQSREY